MNIVLKKIKNIFNKNTIIFIVWVLLVILWNFCWPNVKPIYDVVVAILLSLLTMLSKKLIK